MANEKPLTKSQYIKFYAGDIDDYLISIVNAVYHAECTYHLKGDERTEFLKKCIMTVINAGGKPVKESVDPRYYWQVETKYGETAEDIANNMIAEWQAAGEPNPEWGEYCFAAAHVYTELR